MSTDAISPLRQRMIEDMSARKLNPHKQRSHIRSCKRFAAYLKRSPGTSKADEIPGRDQAPVGHDGDSQGSRNARTRLRRRFARGRSGSTKSTARRTSSASCRPRGAKTATSCCHPRRSICCGNGGRRDRPVTMPAHPLVYQAIRACRRLILSRSWRPRSAV